MTASLKTRFSFFLLAGFGLAAAAHAQSNFTTSYILQPSGNQTAIGNGGTLTFPAINLNSSATASFIAYNSGAATAVVNSVSVTGAAFKVSGLPLLPANVAAGSEVRFTITFTPTTRGVSTGVLTLDIGGSRVNINLAGQAGGASLAYTATLNCGPAGPESRGAAAVPPPPLGGPGPTG